MKKIYAVYALTAIVALSACTKEDFSHEGGNGGSLTIGKLSIREMLLKSDSGANEGVVYNAECGGSTFAIEEVVSPILSEDTKATIITDLSSFKLEGYLDENIKNMAAASDVDKANQHFMNNVSVESGHTVGIYNWRNMVNHYFWAYYGGVRNFSVTSGTSGDQYGKATFDYTNEGGEDVLVAKNMVYWKEGDNGALPLSFNHALSAVQANVSGVKIMVKSQDGSTTTEDPTRGTVQDVKIISDATGACSVDGDISWTTSSTGESISVSILGSPDFVIPQNKVNAHVIMTITDTKRTITRDYELNLGTSWAGNWAEGYKYTYNLSGNIVMPYVDPEKPIGLDINFPGTPSQDQQLLLDDLDYNLIKKIEVAWDGLPTANGKGTVVIMCLIPYEETLPPLYSEYFTGSGQNKAPVISNPRIGFGYSPETPQGPKVFKGTVNGTHCICQFDLSELPSSASNRYKLVAMYDGGDKGGASWHATNLTLKVIEWR